MYLHLWLLLISLTSVLSLDNGLALTPPMGWMSWERFRCITDCAKYPDECISENLIKRIADRMVSDGYLKAGYEYVIIDDCWLSNLRENNKITPNATRFPSGIKALSDYVHSKGLKFGIYEDYGNLTCGGYPGILGNERNDIETLASYDIDYLKLDGCYVDTSMMDSGYPQVGGLLNKTGRPIVYSCSWPAYQKTPNYESIAQHCNLWRNYDDIDDSWESVRNITQWFADNQDTFAHLAGPGKWNDPDMPNYTSIADNCNLWRNYGDIDDDWDSVFDIKNWFGDNQNDLIQHAGPGQWNDPDMLIIGNYGLSIDQARVQMAVWAILAAPLLMSVDLATIRPEFKEILLNKEVIDVNQDKLGKQGRRIIKGNKKNGVINGVEVWSRELSDGIYAVAFVNDRTDGYPQGGKFTFEMMGIPEDAYDVQELFNEEEDREIEKGNIFEVRINPTGVKFFKFTPKSCRKAQNLNKKKTGKLFLNNKVKDRIYSELFNEEEDREIEKGNIFEVRINPTGVKFFKFTPKSCRKAQNLNKKKTGKLFLNNKVKDRIYSVNKF